MRSRAWLTLLLLQPALCAFAGPARAAPSKGRLDRGFGHAGAASARVPKAANEVRGFAVAPSGRIYVLDRKWLIAFQADGRLARGFGHDGRLTISPALGDGGPAALAIDSKGRLLLAGSTRPTGEKAAMAYVIRLLPNGSRDAGFGSDGEVDTDFGLPALAAGEGPGVEVSSVIVDARDRPVVGGSYGKEGEACGFEIGTGSDPFVGRLTAAGAVDETFAEAGHSILAGPAGVASLSGFSGNATAAFVSPCSTPPRFEARSPLFTEFTETGEAVAGASGHGLGFDYGAPIVDSKGRVLELESPPPAAEGIDQHLVRYLPNGDRDKAFGHHGRVLLHGAFSETEALAVDPRGRAIIASETSEQVLRRFLPNGKVDERFGPDGRLTAKGETPRAIALDARGRIYTVSLADGKSHKTIKVDRFIPGD